MAWERSFEKRVLKVRERELKYQKLSYMVELLFNVLWYCLPFVSTPGLMVVLQGWLTDPGHHCFVLAFCSYSWANVNSFDRIYFCKSTCVTWSRTDFIGANIRSSVGNSSDVSVKYSDISSSFQ